MEKETLEEAAEKYAENKSSASVFQETHKRDFIEGAKWQAEKIGLMEIELNNTKTLLESCEKALENRDKKAERMYSEEEVIKIIYQLHLEMQTDKDFTFMKVDEWFEQFKKK